MKIALDKMTKQIQPIGGICRDLGGVCLIFRPRNEAFDMKSIDKILV